jgi:hypothetical protein
MIQHSLAAGEARTLDRTRVKHSQMYSLISKKLRTALRNLPYLIRGYSIHVNRDKFDLMDLTFTKFCPEARSFADLGGVWNVDAAYTVYTIRRYPIDRAFLLDTDIPPKLASALRCFSNLEVIQGDFGSPSIAQMAGSVDVIFFFDVLLHQANPDWDEILERYSRTCSCFVIYNQQFVRGEETIRLTDLPFGEYIELTSDHAKEFTSFVYEHKDDIHPKFNKPWKDVHNIAQWGITDQGLRNKMSQLGFTEVLYRNHGMFIDLPAFENHAFVFKRTQPLDFLFDMRVRSTKQ